MKLQSISKTIITQIGSIVKIEFVDVSEINSIGLPNALKQMAASAVVLNAGKTWKNLEHLSNCSLVDESENTIHGDLYEINISGSTMVEPTERAKLNRLLSGRLVLKVTDGNGFIFLVGNKTEYCKFSLKNDTGENRSVAQLNKFTALAQLTEGIIQLI